MRNVDASAKAQLRQVYKDTSPLSPARCPASDTAVPPFDQENSRWLSIGGHNSRRSGEGSKSVGSISPAKGQLRIVNQETGVTRVAIVYHSGYGHTARQAEAVKEGAGSVEGVESTLLTVEEAPGRWDDLAAADAIVFGTPTYMASVSAAFKAFEEASSHAVMSKGFLWKDKFASGFTNSGSRSGDKLASLIQIALFAAQHGMHWVNLGLPPANTSSTGSEEELNRHGFWLGAGAQSNTDQGPDLAPPEADLLTARHLGRRVAETTRQFVRGRLLAEQETVR